MTTTNNKPATKSTALGERAMLVDLTIRKWTPRRADAEASQQVIDANGMADGSGTFWKKLMPHNPQDLKKIDSKAAEVGRFHREITLPWLDGGVRCLTRDAFHQYADRMRVFRREFAALVADFANNIDAHKDAARQMLGTRYDAEEYPCAEDLIASYEIKFDFMPISDPSDFRVALDAEGMAEVSSSYKSMVDAKMADAMADAFGRLRDTVATFADRIGRVHEARKEHERKLNDGEKVGQVPTLRDSTVESLRDLCNVLPMLNLSNDPMLDELIDDVRNKLAIVEADDLRTGAAVRVEAVSNSQAILDKLNAFLS